MAEDTPFDFIQDATRRHRAVHGCGAYTFGDGPGLMALAQGLQPARVLELGTALGYTACCLAAAGGGTHVDTIEGDSTHVTLARENIRSARLESRITVHDGDFRAVLASLAGPYQLAFFDGFAPSLPLITQLRGLLAPDGVLVCSNLQLVNARNRRPLDADLRDTGRWLPIGCIEGGGTEVFRKVTAA